MKYNVDDYPYTLRSLPKDEGGGFFIEYSDLPGCYSDGETVKQFLRLERMGVKRPIAG